MKKLAFLSLSLLAACKGGGGEQPAPRTYDQLERGELNKLAVREDLPLFWIADADGDRAIDPDEVASLRFYSTETVWVEGGKFTPAFDAAYQRLLAARTPPKADDPAEQRRLDLVIQELDQGRPALVATDLSTLSEGDQRFVDHMLAAARKIDSLYDRALGVRALADQVTDTTSRRLFMRNHGPACQGPATEKEPECTAIKGAPEPKVDVYPAALQERDDFCAALVDEDVRRPFTVVREQGGKLVAVPYTEAYADEMEPIAKDLEAAAGALDPAAEAPLIAYLRAAAKAFRSNDWEPADEAWAAMNAENSKWYVRAAPDEVYWEPCALKAGFHLTFAKIDQSSLAWQAKLTPIQQEMEAAIADRAGAPYKAREVSFHLPDFIQIVVNAGDDRDPFGATVGQSLPNWGPVANEGRGRTVAMTNLFTDPDSLATRRAQAESLLDAASMSAYVDADQPGLLGTILHEATHNLGPAHEYAVDGKTDDVLFGGPMASVMEELKAQTGALFLIDLLRSRGVIDDALARQTYVDSVVWAFGHISRGMYTATGDRKAYSQLAAIQVGYLLDAGALRWDPDAVAANGTDKGAVSIDYDKMAAASDAMMKDIGGIKARGDRKAADALAAKYVDGKTVPQEIIAERLLRHPRASFVYAITR